MQPREGAYLLLADIEEAETGDQGRVRQHLARAVRAPRDPAWVADGFVSDRWAPVSPVTGRLDAFEWRVPVERLGQLIEQGAPDHPSLALPSRVEPATVDGAEVIEATDDVVAGPLEADEAEVAPKEAEPELPEEAEATPVEPARMPDDPGVDPGQGQSERRFRLF
jgi:HemY protein